MTKNTLFALWGGLFVLCAGLGFLPGSHWSMTLAAILFFLPPAVLLYRASGEKDRHTLLLIRNLSALSLALSAVLLVVNFLTALASETLGNFVHCLLVIVSSPMICSGHWALSLFGWACLLMVSLKEIRKPRT